MSFSDDPINLYINFDVDDEISTSKLIEYKHLTIGKLFALFYVESPFLGLPGDIDLSLKVLQSDYQIPTEIINEIENREDTVEYKVEIIEVLTHSINSSLKPFKTWGGENSGKSLGSHYLSQIKVIMQSKLNYTENGVFYSSVRKALYEIITYNELDSGENILMTKKELKDLEDLKSLKNNAKT